MGRNLASRFSPTSQVKAIQNTPSQRKKVIMNAAFPQLLPLVAGRL